MKLYYATGTCSLGPRIVAHELGIELESQKVDIKKHQTDNGSDYWHINPKGYVPALMTDDGYLLTEGVAIMQYLADQGSPTNLNAERGSSSFYQLQEWLTFISTELHKMFSPWLFHPEYGSEAQRVATQKIYERFEIIEEHLEDKQYLVDDEFSLADIYLFTVVRWAELFRIELASYRNLSRLLEKIFNRSAVQSAMRAEGIIEN
ncbi:glutathione S-transferase [Chromohalobacter canadensis]|uniref:Glutathione S-transferase n=1 Tax=Chromohalobacter canadensis TaxID=141389 RepID=A0A285VLX7_9GAMM|nr:glutathione transferase GstA [Chromohalobacter canadensis]SOC55090.1 glutathione S-transferase [Chromohalobacter canadensis]